MFENEFFINFPISASFKGLKMPNESCLYASCNRFFSIIPPGTILLFSHSNVRDVHVALLDIKFESGVLNVEIGCDARGFVQGLDCVI